MIEVKNLFIKIDGKSILEDLSARIKKGEVTAILGPNGSGKSTLLRCLTGAQKVDRGTILLDEKRFSDYSLKDLSIKRAVLSQSNPINFPFTAMEIVMIGRHPHFESGATGKNNAIALQALESVDAAHLSERIFPTLSGGEQQRVQLARVLAQLWEQEDAYLFLDEPTVALDLKHQHQLLSHVSKLAKEKHFAVCVIMHDLNLAMRYAGQVILLKDGKLFATGDIATALNKDRIEEVFEVPGEYVQLTRPIEQGNR